MTPVPSSSVTASYKHGFAPKREKRHSLYTTWKGMRERCRREKHVQYKDYGGKGVVVCDDWHDFRSFYQWAVSNGWQAGLQIDRIDSNGNYCPENCRWVTPLENSANKQNLNFIEAWGDSKHLSAWARDARCLVPPACLYGRIRKGWNLEVAMSTVSGIRNNYVTCFGETKSLNAWEKDSRCLVTRHTIKRRISCGWNACDALTTPKFQSN